MKSDRWFWTDSLIICVLYMHQTIRDGYEQSAGEWAVLAARAAHHLFPDELGVRQHEWEHIENAA